MSSWLSDLERRRKEEEQEKYRQEQTQKAQQEQEEAKALWLRQQYKPKIEFIYEQIKQLVERANATGFIKLQMSSWPTSAPINITRISDDTNRSINVSLEEDGQVVLVYSWKQSYGRPGTYEWKPKHSYHRVPIQSVTSSHIDTWGEWVATGKGFCPPSEEDQKGFFSRLFGR